MLAGVSEAQKRGGGAHDGDHGTPENTVPTWASTRSESHMDREGPPLIGVGSKACLEMKDIIF